jgi:membrane protease YdiL (CAAX protease family)
MTPEGRPPGGWGKWPVALRALIIGAVIALVAANVWPPLLLSLGVAPAAAVEAIFLVLFLWWAAGGGPPARTRAARVAAFRRSRLSVAQWAWGLVAAVAFAATIHAAVVLLFRLVPYPAQAFRQSYAFLISSIPLKWLAIVMSAASAGICEEIGFRGYMQQPIERRHGTSIAIAVSSLSFTLVHLNQAWATVGMVPIVCGAGVLLGLLAWSSGSLLPGMIGHTVMDIGMFAYWWTGFAGDFSARPITETGVDAPFLITCAVLASTCLAMLLAMWRLQQMNRPSPEPMTVCTPTTAV